MRSFLALEAAAVIVVHAIFNSCLTGVENGILIRIAPIYSPALVIMFSRQYLCRRLILLVSQPIWSNFRKFIVYLGLSFYEFLLGLFQERICFGTGKRVLDLLLLEASEKRDLLAA